MHFAIWSKNFPVSGSVKQDVWCRWPSKRRPHRCQASHFYQASSLSASIQQNRAVSAGSSTTVFPETVSAGRQQDADALPEVEDKVGVLLLNLGGPETLDDVQPFLYNLFVDESIIRLPAQSTSCSLLLLHKLFTSFSFLLISFMLRPLSIPLSFLVHRALKETCFHKAEQLCSSTEHLLLTIRSALEAHTTSSSPLALCTCCSTFLAEAFSHHHFHTTKPKELRRL